VIPFYQNENHYEITSKEIAVLYLMKLKYMPTFNMNWINARPLKCKSIGSKDTVNATVVAGKVPGFKYYKK
jgi:hypothetical protein